jgi:hypothetical protein
VDATPLLALDEETSDLKDLDRKPGGYDARLCRYHGLQYQARQMRTKCVRSDCRNPAAGEHEGMRLCREHLGVFADARKTRALATALPLTGAPSEPPASLARGVLVTVWVGFRQGTGDEPLTYYKFRGRVASAKHYQDVEEDRVVVEVPSLQVSYAVPADAVGPWESDILDSLKGAQAPALVEKGQLAKRFSEGQDARGGDLPGHRWGEAALNADEHYYTNVVRPLTAKRALTPEPLAKLAQRLRGDPTSSAFPDTRAKLDHMIQTEAVARQSPLPLPPLQAPAPEAGYLWTYLEEIESGATEEGALRTLQDMHAEGEAAVLHSLIHEARRQAGDPSSIGGAGRAWMEERIESWKRRADGAAETPRAQRLLRQAPWEALPATPPRFGDASGLAAPAAGRPRPGAHLSSRASSSALLAPPLLGLSNAAAPQTGSTGQPPGLRPAGPGTAFAFGDLIRQPSRRDGYAGAGDGGAEELAGAIGSALGTHLEPALRSGLAPIGHVLDALRRQNEDEKATAEGTLGHLRGHCRWYVYLARGCDEMEVSLCEGLLGRDLYDGLRRAGDGARALLTMVKWPVPINVRIAYGFASGNLGGRDIDTMPEWSLSAADFWPATQEVFDDFVPSADHKREKRPRYPQTMAQWAKCADNEIRAFALVYGSDHAAERLEVRQRLERLHEENHHEWPREEVWVLWEELTWRWWEEIWHQYRILLKEMSTDTVTRNDLKFYALAPGPRFRFPGTWDLDEPSGYFQLVVLPRRQRVY